MSLSLFEFNVRPIIHYRFQIWTLTRRKHEPDGLGLIHSPSRFHFQNINSVKKKTQPLIPWLKPDHSQL